MNFLPLRGASLINRVPFYKPRSQTIQYLLLGNLSVYGLYLLATGPRKLQYRRNFVLEQDSNYTSFLLCHFGHTSLTNLIFNSAIIYTIGNYHVLKYGCTSFLMLYGLGCVAGGVMAAMNA